MKTFSIGRIVLTILSTTLLTHADESALSIRTLSLEKEGLPEWYLQTGEDEFEKISWPNAQPSPAMMAQAGKELVLFEKVAAKEGEPGYKAAMKMAVAEAAKEILLLASASKDGEGFEVVAIPDNYKQAGFKDWLVINRCDRKVSLRYGKDKEPIELVKGQSGIYQIEPVEGEGGEAVAHAQIRNDMRKIYSTFWGAPEKQRSLIIFHIEDERIKVRHIKDFLPVQKEAE